MRRISLSYLALSVLAAYSFAADTNGPRKAPELTFNLPGQGQKTLAQYQGKVVALEFILTTCSHCQAASRVMTQLQQEYGSRGFQALDLAINGLDEGRNQEQANALVENFARDFQVGFPVGWVRRDQFMAFMGFSLAELTMVPQLALIDRKGYIHYQTPPKGDSISMQESTIRQRIEELLALGNSNSKSSSPKRPAAAKKGI